MRRDKYGPTHNLQRHYIDAFGKAVAGLKAIVNLPTEQRKTIYETLRENYLLRSTTINMVIIRLGDILLQQKDEDFLREVARLDNSQEWLQAEREFRLCYSLQVALRNMETLVGNLLGVVSTKEWDALLQEMRTILTGERDVAMFISHQFQKLASDARSTGQDSDRTQSIRQALQAFRDALLRERNKLMEQEQAIYLMV